MPLQYNQIPTAQVPGETPPSLPPTSKTVPTTSIHPVKKLAFVEIVFGEIILGIVIVALIFGTLNYFNILSLEKSFPGLSFLPKKQEIVQNQTLVYDSVKANADADAFAREYLKDAFQPTDKKDNQFIDNTLTRQWSTSDPKIFVSQTLKFQAHTNTDQILKLVVSNIDTSLQAGSPSAALAVSQINRFLKVGVDTADWVCDLSGQIRCTAKTTKGDFIQDIRVFWSNGIINVVACKIATTAPDALQLCVPTN